MSPVGSPFGCGPRDGSGTHHAASSSRAATVSAASRAFRSAYSSLTFALASCLERRLHLLRDLVQAARSEDLDPSERESANGIEDMHRESIAGCEDAAIGKVERTTS